MVYLSELGVKWLNQLPTTKQSNLAQDITRRRFPHIILNLPTQTNYNEKALLHSSGYCAHAHIEPAIVYGRPASAGRGMGGCFITMRLICDMVYLQEDERVYRSVSLVSVSICFHSARFAAQLADIS